MQLTIGIIAVLIMAGALGGTYYLSFKQNAEIGLNAIRFLAIVFTLPLLIALGVTGVLHAETIGPLLGVIVGYVLTGAAKRE